MAAAAGTLKLDVTLNGDDPDGDVMKIFEKIRPGWKRADLKRKTLGEDAAMVNKMYVYSNRASAESCDDAIVVRIYGTEFEEYSDRDREIRVSLLFNEIGVSPKVHCTFKNGMCMSFVKGKTYNLTDREVYSSKKLALAVAKELAHIHSKKTAQLAMEKYGVAKEIDTAKAAFRMAFEVWGPDIDQLDPLITSPGFPSKDQVLAEMDRVEQVLEDLGMPVVISHNDMHPANTIFNQATETVTVIDYEYSFFNYDGWDLAQYLFFSACGVCVDKEPPKMHKIDYKKDFLRTYLESLSCHDNWGRKVTETDVDQLLAKVNKFTMYVLLVQIPINLIVAMKPPENFSADTNWCRAALNSWKMYLATRKEILGF